MPLPASLQAITVTGNYLDLFGVAVNGSIQFDIEGITALYSPTDNVIVLPKSIVANITSGVFSATLAATNDPDTFPQFSYRVVETFPSMGVTRTYTISLPYTTPSPVSIADIIAGV